MKIKLLFASALTFFSITCIYAQVPTLNLEAQYRFSGNADDTGPNNYDGTNFGATLTADRFGTPNAAYDFAAAGYIDCNDVMDNIIAGSGRQLTISFWVKPAGANANNIVLAKHADAGCGLNQRQFFIRVLADQVNVEYYGDLTGGFGRFVCGTSTLTNTSHWYNVIVTYDGTINTNNGLDRVQIYVDGVMETTTMSCRVQSGTFPFDITSGPAHFGIGNYLTGTGTPCLSSTKYNGKIDDIRLYSRVVNSTEIGQLFNESTAGISSIETGSSFELFPNPAQDAVSIRLTDLAKISATSELRICNALGEIVHVQTLNGSGDQMNIDLKGYPKGVYFVAIFEGDQQTAGRKLVVQ